MASASSVLLFANPNAGRGAARRATAAIAGQLLLEGYHVHPVIQHPTSFDPQQAAGAVAAISIGGDGTLRAVADMLSKAPHPVPIVVVPMGTANLMGKHLDLRWGRRDLPEQILAAIRGQRVIWMDAGRANGKLFLLMAGVGFDAQIVHELDRLRRGPIDLASYVLPAALAVRDYAYPPIRISVDDTVVFDDGPAVAFVANIPEYGTGFPLLPRAKANDGLLDICVLPCRDMRQLMKVVLRASVGEHLDVEGAVYLTGTRVMVESTVEVPVQLDGDSAGHTPMAIELLPRAVPFIVP